MNTSNRIHCAIYARTTAADARRLAEQREAAVAYIGSCSTEGLAALPDCYDDDGHSGNTADRIGLRRLMDDVAAEKVNRVAVERFDRLARSRTVFAELLAFLRRHGVELASATEPPAILGAILDAAQSITQDMEGGVA